MYKLIYSQHFEQSLTKTIVYWQTELLLPESEIRQFVQLIDQNLHRLIYFPYMFSNVQNIYHLHAPTYKINIGKQYAIFYRVNEKSKTVLIGPFFSNKQMKIDF